MATAMTPAASPPPPPQPPLATVLRVRRRKRRRATSGGGGEGAGRERRHEHDYDDHHVEAKEEESRGGGVGGNASTSEASAIPKTLRIISSLNNRRKQESSHQYQVHGERSRTNKESSSSGNDRGKRPRTGSRYPFDPETDERLSNLLHESTYISRRPRPRPRPIDAAEPSRRRSSGGVGFGCYSQECSDCDEDEYYGDGGTAKDMSTRTATAPGCGTGEVTSERKSSPASAAASPGKLVDTNKAGLGGHGNNGRKRKATTRSVLFRRMDSSDAAAAAAANLASSSGAVRVVECSLSDSDGDDECPIGGDGGVSNKRHRRHHHHHGRLRVVCSPEVRSAAEVFSSSAHPRTTSAENGQDVKTSDPSPPGDEEKEAGGDDEGDYVYDIFYVAEDGGRGASCADAGKGNNENRDTIPSDAVDGDDDDVITDPAFFWGERFGRVEDVDGDDDDVGRGAEFHGADGAASGRRESSSMTVELRGGHGYLDDLGGLILGNDQDVDFGDCLPRDGRDHDHDHDSDVHDSNDEGYDGNDYPDEEDEDGDDPFDDGDYGDVTFASSSSDEDGDDGGRRRMRMMPAGGDITSWKRAPGGGAGACGWSIDHDDRSDDDDHYGGGDGLELFDDEDGCGFGGSYLGCGTRTGRGFHISAHPPSSSPRFAYDPDLDDDDGGGGDHDDYA